MKTARIDILVLIIASIKEATVLICFKMNGVKMEMTSRAFVEEEFVRGMEKPFLQITLEKPTIKEVEPTPEVTIRTRRKKT